LSNSIVNEPGLSTMRNLQQSLPLKLLMAREAVMDRFRPKLKRAGVTEQQWRVLRALSETDEMDAGELAQAICLRMPSLSRILADLNERRLVQKHLGADRRLRIVRATRQGRALVERLSPLSEQQYRGGVGRQALSPPDEGSRHADRAAVGRRDRRVVDRSGAR
jgi:homoprotocatechuate degradation regulator HpaR